MVSYLCELLGIVFVENLCAILLYCCGDDLECYLIVLCLVYYGDCLYAIFLCNFGVFIELAPRSIQPTSYAVLSVCLSVCLASSS